MTAAAPKLQDAKVLVAVWLPPPDGKHEVPSLAEYRLQHPADAEGWKTLSDGSRLGLVTLEERDGRPEAELVLECRKRVDAFLQTCGWKELRFLQKWPLHQPGGQRALLMHALAPKLRQLRYTERFFWWQTAGRLPFLDRIHQAFGEAIAWSFGWQVTFSVGLFILALFSTAGTAVKWSEPLGYQSMMPLVSLLLITWCICITENQSIVMKRLESHWQQLVPARPTRASDEMSELSSEVSFSHSRRISSRRWRQDFGLKCSAFLRRNVRFQLCCAPILIMEWLFIWTFFLAFFWLQLWTTFEWGGCREYNERTGTRDCMSPEFLHPVWGKVLAAVPSFLQGFVFEFVSGLSKLSVALIVKMQSWDSQDEMRRAAATYYFFLEVVGKLGFICVLGFLYVPDYGGDEFGCADRLDFWFLGSWSFSCLKQNVPRSVRLQLFLASVRGPFLTAGLFGIFKKTLLPILLEHLRSREPTTQPWQCLVRCSIAVVRFFMLLLYCDLYARDAGAAASLGSLPRVAHHDASTESAESDAIAATSITTSMPWRQALKEGQRRAFDPLKECVELLMNFLWVACFASVYPLGGLLAFANQALELRCDTLKLLAARRRPWPRGANAEKEWVPSCARWIVHIAIVMNVLVLLLPFALAASDCHGILIVENPCTKKTILAAVLTIVGLEFYWRYLSILLRWASGLRQRSGELGGGAVVARPEEGQAEGGFSPEILPSTLGKERAPSRAPGALQGATTTCCPAAGRWCRWL